MQRAHLDTLLAVLTNIPPREIKKLIKAGYLTDVAEFVAAVNALAREAGREPEFTTDGF